MVGLIRFGRRIQERRKARGLTEERRGSELGVSDLTVGSGTETVREALSAMMDAGFIVQEH